jgi:signal transduction histidine kinase
MASRRLAPTGRWIVLTGLIAAAVTVLGSAALRTVRLGWSDAAAAARVESEVRATVDERIASLRSTASDLARRPDLVEYMGTERDAARELFDLLDTVIDERAPRDLAITVYAPNGRAHAWSGRASELAANQILEAAVFAAPGSSGLRLVHVEPITDAEGRRLGSVVTERVLSPAGGVRSLAPADFPLETSLATVSLRLPSTTGAPPEPHQFVLRSRAGDALLEASIAPAALEAAQRRWWRYTAALAIWILALTALALTGPVLDRRGATGNAAAFRSLTLAAAALVLLARALLWFGVPVGWLDWPLVSPAILGPDPPALLRSPLDLLLHALTAAALVALAAPAAGLARVQARRARRAPAAVWPRFILTQAVAGALVAAAVVAFELYLRQLVGRVTIDPLHFSLHPWNHAGRIAVVLSVVILHAAALWAGVLVLVRAVAPWRVDRARRLLRPGLIGIWVAPTLAVALVTASGEGALPGAPMILAAGACAAAALVGPRVVVRYRHASHATRLVALFLALLLPALLLYPSMLYFADRAKRESIETKYTTQAMHHTEELLSALTSAQQQVEAMPSLAAAVASTPPDGAYPPSTDAAFLIWSQTALAEARLTSAIELYDASGRLASRFALNFPEYEPVAQTYQSTSCEWEVFGEAAPFGSEERRMLHAERGICLTSPDGASRIIGAILIHVMLDYRAVPLISSQSPYVELFRETGSLRHEATPSRDLELVIYGWGLSPIYSSGPAAWPITDAVFARVYDPERRPFWTTIDNGRGPRYHVHFTNDRWNIYAIGYPALSLFDFLVHLAELSALSGLAYIVLLAGSAVFVRVARRRQGMGRALLREIRASFSRKLSLAFVAASVVPVLTLALVIRVYFAGLLRADVASEAARTAAVAQRVVESAALQRGDRATPIVNDDVMVFISQVIDQDVNIFDGPQLLATSERDLFASGLLPTRTPHDVYRAIVLQRLPSYVGEDEIGGVPYLLAAAPVRAGGSERMLTVPLASRQQEIEREIDDLDRGVQLAALVFILLGAALGLSMAERIADPVKRLTRATRRITAGDFDARIAVRSSDELRRLVEAFNRMAADLKAQRADLERTNRLEAWAEMARQVAHEIKNPLTPIQLSAEHLRRVHADRGEPLSPVLDDCIDSILGQVRLLRQISAEFSSFASSPTARPAPFRLHDLIGEVVGAYRTGLEGRVTISSDIPTSLRPVFADRTLVARALTNIIENALHAMPGAGTLALSAVETDGRVRLRIADSGVGMDRAALARIFEPYFSTRTTGTGLGLTIARRNIELNGGTIQVESEKGRGTIVTVDLPAGGPTEDVAAR